MSTVAWLISVMRSSPPSTPEGGFVCSTSATKRGDGSGRLASFHRRRSRKPRTCGASGLKKRFPSKCFGNGGAPSPSGDPVLVAFNKLPEYNLRNPLQDGSACSRTFDRRKDSCCNSSKRE